MRNDELMKGMENEEQEKSSENDDDLEEER